MSEMLQQKLQAHREKLLVAQATQRVLALLSSIDAVQVVELDQEINRLNSVTTAYHSMIQIDALPFSRITDQVSDERRLQWLCACLKQAHIGEECYLNVAIASTPWVRVRGSAEKRWIKELWHLSDVHELLFIDINKEVMLGFFKEEDEDQAFIHRLTAENT